MSNMKKIKIIIGITGLYLILYTFSIIILSNYESMYVSEIGGWYSWDSFTVIETVAYFIYKFILPLPLGFILWFYDELLFINIFLILPNIFLVSYIYIKYRNKKVIIRGKEF